MVKNSNWSMFGKNTQHGTLHKLYFAYLVFWSLVSSFQACFFMFSVQMANFKLNQLTMIDSLELDRALNIPIYLKKYHSKM